MRLLFDQMRFVALQILLIFRILGRVLLAFFRDNPFLSTGVGLGLLLAVPVGWVPLIGVFLAPIAIPFGLAIGAIAGHRLDRMRQGLEVSDQPAAMFEYLVAAFKALLSLFGDFYRELRDHFSRAPDQGDRVIEGRARREQPLESRLKALEAAHRAAERYGYDLQELVPSQPPKRAEKGNPNAVDEQVREDSRG
jgi:hypothetical protein